MLKVLKRFILKVYSIQSVLLHIRILEIIVAPDEEAVV